MKNKSRQALESEFLGEGIVALTFLWDDEELTEESVCSFRLNGQGLVLSVVEYKKLFPEGEHKIIRVNWNDIESRLNGGKTVKRTKHLPKCTKMYQNEAER